MRVLVQWHKLLTTGLSNWYAKRRDLPELDLLLPDRLHLNAGVNRARDVLAVPIQIFHLDAHLPRSFWEGDFANRERLAIATCHLAIGNCMQLARAPRDPAGGTDRGS